MWKWYGISGVKQIQLDFVLSGTIEQNNQVMRCIKKPKTLKPVLFHFGGDAMAYSYPTTYLLFGFVCVLVFVLYSLFFLFITTKCCWCIITYSCKWPSDTHTRNIHLNKAHAQSHSLARDVKKRKSIQKKYYLYASNFCCCFFFLVY